MLHLSKSGGPSSQWLEQFHILVDNLYNQNIPLVILGDLNINLLKDQLFAVNLKAEYHLSQSISKLIRICKITSSLIDHLYTSDRALVASRGVAELHLLDHRIIFCNLMHSSKLCISRKIYYLSIHSMYRLRSIRE